MTGAPKSTLFQARLEAHAAKGRVALVVHDRDIDFVELVRRTRTCAAWLAHQRLVAGEVVGITLDDDLAHIVVTLALLFLGVPHVCLPTHEPAAKRRALAGRLGVRRVVTMEPRHELADIQSLRASPEHLADRDTEAVPPCAIDADAPAAYYASSGATGDPKLFALSQRALAWRAERIAESEQARSDYRSLTFVPIEDSMARSRMLSCTYMGFASVLPAAGSSLQEVCSRQRVTCLELTVLQVASFAAEAGDPNPLPQHTTVYTAGAMVPPTLRRSFESRFGVPLFIHYGAREFGRISTTFPTRDGEDPDSVGVPVPWIELEIVDSEGRALPRGAIGEIRVRSECMSSEYHGDPIATARHFQDGWIYPRDLGCLTAGGVLRLYGRADDMMNLNGIKIFPAEIERVLEAHPAVKAAAAFSKWSAAHGDIPLAAVELHDTASVTADELMERARERLGMRAPRRILVLETLPRNASGKVVRRKLADLLASSVA